MSRKERRKASMVLSGLVVTDDAGLKGFRDMRAADPDLDLELLKRARDVLDHVYDAIAEKDDEAWSRVSKAWRILEAGDKKPKAKKKSAPPPEKPAEDDDKAAAADEPVAAASAVPAPQQKASSPDDDDVAPPPSIGSILAGDGIKAPTNAEPAKPSPWVSPSRAATLQGMALRPPVTSQPPPVASQPPPVTSQPPPVASQPPPVASQPPSARERHSSQPDSGEPERIEPVPASQPTMALPHEPGASPPLPSGAPAAAAEPEDANLMTMSADVEAADYMAFALPFKDGVAAAPESGLREGEENEPFGETMSLRSLGASGAVLPAGFREQLKKAAEDEAARQASIQRAAAFRDDEERTALHAYEPPSASPLPFESAPSSDEAPGLAESGSEPTMRMSVGKLPRPESGNEPPPSLPSHLASMTVEQYAALCAECAVHAEWADQISAGRYNVRDRAERELLDRVFRARMAADPQVAETWRTTYARVEQWAKQQRESRG